MGGSASGWRGPRKAAVEDVTSGQKLHLRAVIVVARPHRADDGQVVNAVTHVWEPVTDFDS